MTPIRALVALEKGVAPEAIRTVYASAAFSGAYIFAMILGITGMTGEYRYQTITPTVPRANTTSST